MYQIAILAAALVTALAAPEGAGMEADCIQTRDPELGVSGCTAVIVSGQHSGTDLAWAYYNRGIAYYDLGEFARAIEDYDEALRLDPDDGDSYNNRGNAYYKLGEFARAIEDYDEALRLDAGDAVAYFNRGNSYDDLGELARAIEDYGEALRLDPDYAVAYYNRGSAYDDLGE